MKLSFRYRFEAAHRFTDATSKCSTPHGHSWWVTLSLSHSAGAIDLKKNFAADFKDLKTDWKRFVDEDLDHHLFLNSSDPLSSYLFETQPDVRLKHTPGDPTTEVLASLFFKKAESIFNSNNIIKVDSILLEETPTNSVRVFQSDVETFLSNLEAIKNPWW